LGAILTQIAHGITNDAQKIAAKGTDKNHFRYLGHISLRSSRSLRFLKKSFTLQ
jgi:hypothetical protein